MDPAQKEYIIQNKNDLIEFTKCDVYLCTRLRARNLLSDADMQRLADKKATEWKFAECNCLYDILMTKMDSYNQLIEALDNCRQTGAVAILKNIGDCSSSSQTQASRSAPEVDMACDSSYKNYVIGTDECPVEVVAKTLENSSSAIILNRDWLKLARELRVSVVECDELKQAMLFDKITMLDLIIRLLESWKLKKLSEAKLGAFIEILESMKWNHFAHELEKKFEKK